MAVKKVNIGWEAEEAIINQALSALAKIKGIQILESDTPETIYQKKLTAAGELVNEFVRNTVAHVIAEEAQEQARQVAQAGAFQALDMVTKKVEVLDVE